MTSNSANNKRIAKNTLLLYFRMLFLMLISLYTSRVILDALGVDDFGIYNVVGGFVALFAVVSKSLSGAASRFLNYEMGRGNAEKLKNVFSTTVTIHIGLAIIVAILSEAVGVWYVNNKMVIPTDRLVAANWCFQLSVITFCSNLFTVPYNAAVIAHEQMKTFAYVSVFEGIAKLIISYLITISPIDKLILYAILLCVLQFSIRTMYRVYCRKHYNECSYSFIYDKELLRHLFSYAGWGFIGSTSGILRNQGINILINLFFGPAINAARGLSNQVLQAVDGFVTNFITAVKPQITKSYAAGNYEYMNSLIYKSTKFSYFLFIMLSLPIIINADFLLGLWLKSVPEHSVSFVRLTLLFTMITTLSHPLSVAQAATGKIRDYQIVIGGIQLLNLPISYLFLKLGCSPEVVLFVAIAIAAIVVVVSMHMIKRLIPINIKKLSFIIIRVLFTTAIAYSIPVLINYVSPENFLSHIFEIAFSVIYTSLVILFVGLDKHERTMTYSKVNSMVKKILKK